MRVGVEPSVASRAKRCRGLLGQNASAPRQAQPAATISGATHGRTIRSRTRTADQLNAATASSPAVPAATAQPISIPSTRSSGPRRASARSISLRTSSDISSASSPASASGVFNLDAFLRGDRAVLHRLRERPVVALVLVGVRSGEISDRTVEDVAPAEVGADRDAIAGSRVCAGQRPAARAGVDDEPAWRDSTEIERRLPVPELAHVEVALLLVEAALVADPAEEDVARGLHRPLAFDDALAVVCERAPAEVRLEHGRPCLLDLQEERIAVVATEHQHDPAPRAHTADADHLACQVDVAERLEQLATVPLQRAPVDAHELSHLVLDVAAAVGELADRDDQRRGRDDLDLAVDLLRQPRQGAEAVLRLRLLAPARERASLFDAVLRAELRLELPRVDPRVPEVEVPHCRELAHRLAVGLDDLEDRRPPLCVREAAISCGDLEACSEALDVPFEGAAVRLVEVVQVEHHR